MKRSYERAAQDLRPIKIEPNYYDYAEGSCLIHYGNTKVICVATVEDTVPPHLRNKGVAWITGEYSMLPRASKERIRRERDRVGGRTHEIQRLIGRAMRSVASTEGWGERTIHLDCDVIRADGGTRTASITGAFVALALAFRYIKKEKKIPEATKYPLIDYVSAVSVGLLDGKPILDLDYVEDSSAETDMNLVMTASGKIIEIQGTAEKEPFSEEQFSEMIKYAKSGCERLCKLQRETLGPLSWNGA